jgi:hypothetical protein
MPAKRSNHGPVSHDEQVSGRRSDNEKRVPPARYRIGYDRPPAARVGQLVVHVIVVVDLETETVLTRAICTSGRERETLEFLLDKLLSAPPSTATRPVKVVIDLKDVSVAELRDAAAQRGFELQEPEAEADRSAARNGVAPR